MLIQKGHFGPKGVDHALLKSLSTVPCYSFFFHLMSVADFYQENNYKSNIGGG